MLDVLYEFDVFGDRYPHARKAGVQRLHLVIRQDRLTGHGDVALRDDDRTVRTRPTPARVRPRVPTLLCSFENRLSGFDQEPAVLVGIEVRMRRLREQVLVLDRPPAFGNRLEVEIVDP